MQEDVGAHGRGGCLPGSSQRAADFKSAAARRSLSTRSLRPFENHGSSFSSLPGPILGSWWCEGVVHPGDSQFPQHYHQMDEWVRVTEGTIAFTGVANGQTLEAVAGDCIEIPAGHAHSVRVGASGVKYDMWTPERSDEAFMKRLARGPAHGAEPNEQKLAVLVQANFDIPRWENQAAGDPRALQALEDLLHPSLVFRRANGTIVTLSEYLQRFREPPPSGGKGISVHRWGSTELKLLDLTADSAVVSIVVHTVETDRESLMGRPGAYENIRAFVLEQGRWKCRMWVNYPVSGTQGS
ncbi:cupin domain-containing protein [Corallococcus exiguus]|uniref:cupin domain-containing protein n=1 Tax=Corallococcus exiguus TaxID=83462 RepID=UPI0014719640|nr:cupin domain-containing protein [Corallococcus exiguus]